MLCDRDFDGREDVLPGIALWSTPGRIDHTAKGFEDENSLLVDHARIVYGGGERGLLLRHGGKEQESERSAGFNTLAFDHTESYPD